MSGNSPGIFDVPLPDDHFNDAPLRTERGGSAQKSSAPHEGLRDTDLIESVLFNMREITDQIQDMQHGIRSIETAMKAGGAKDFEKQALEDMLRGTDDLKRFLGSEAWTGTNTIADQVQTATRELKDTARLLNARVHELVEFEEAAPAVGGLRKKLVTIAAFLSLAFGCAVVGAFGAWLSKPDPAPPVSPAVPQGWTMFLDAGNDPAWLQRCPSDRQVKGRPDLCTVNVHR